MVDSAHGNGTSTWYVVGTVGLKQVYQDNSRFEVFLDILYDAEGGEIPSRKSGVYEREKVRSTFLGRQEGQCSTITMRSRLAKPIGMRMCSAEYHGKDIVVVDKVSQNTVSLYAVCQ